MPVRVAARPVRYGSRVRRTIDRESVLAYLARDWQGARDHKREYWRAILARKGLRESLRVNDQLHAWMKLSDPAWPTQEQREEDLETHRRVAEAFATAGSFKTGGPIAARVRARRIR